MNITAKWYNKYQASNPEQFNDDFIKFRKNDDITFYLSGICQILESIDGVVFKGIDYITDESQIWNEETVYKTQNIDDSRVNLAKLKFHISHEDAVNGYKEEDIVLPLYVPKLVEDFYFNMNGCDYAAIFQIVDRGFYTTKSGFVLKTVKMPLVCSNSNTYNVEDIEKNKHSSKALQLKIFKKQLNPMIFTFARFGFMAGVAKLGLTSEHISFYDKPVENDHEYVFKLCSDKYMGVSAEIIDNAKFANLKIKVFTVLEMFNKTRINAKKIEDDSYWLKRLGKVFTTNTNAFESKAEGVLASYESVMDNITKRSLNFISDEDKSDTYAIIRWIIDNFDFINKMDNMDLHNKRIRMMEYIVHPLQVKFNAANNRNINNGRNNNFNAKKRIFTNIGINFLIKKLLTDNLHRYNNCVSDMDLFSAGLKYSFRGPQSLAEANPDDISDSYRDVHPSYIGRLEIASNSNSDPGLQGTIVPFIKTNGGFFDETKYEFMDD